MPGITARRGTLSAALIALALTAPLALSAPEARAGSYDVLACNAAPGGEHSSWQVSSQAAGYVAGFTCPANGSQDGMYGRNGVGVGTAPAGSQTSLTFTAPPGASVSGLSVDAYMGTSQDWFSSVGSAGSTTWGCLPNDGVTQCSYTLGGAYINVGSAPSVSFTVGCQSPAGCPTGWDSAGLTGVGAQGWFYLQSARVTVSDSSPPSVSVADGALAGGEWLSGTQSVALSAEDNVGVKGSAVTVDGVQLDSRLEPCDYTKAVPCPAGAGGSFSLDTHALGDGSHTLRVSATDSANNTALSEPLSLRVDNSAPEVDVIGAPDPERWQAAPVDLTLAAHDQPGLSGMDGGALEYSLDGDAFQRIDGSSAAVTISGDGVHTLGYRAIDAAGNGSAERSLTVRVDGGVPGAAQPEGSGGWISGAAADRLVEHVRMAPGALVPPSGIAGYSVTLDGSLPDASVDTDESGELEIGSLPEGETVVRARAISGAGVASAETGSATLLVDRSAPSIAAEGADASWHAGPVPIILRGSDPLSGMDGGRIVYSLDGGREHVAPGAEADVQVTGDGRHELAYRAVDAAGNASAERTLPVLIDATAPETVVLEEPPPAVPSEIAARVADAGSDVARGAIEMRAAGVSVWRALPTRLEAGRLVAPLDSSALARGLYEFRARAVDAAGNERVGSELADGRSLELLLGPEPVSTPVAAQPSTPVAAAPQAVAPVKPAAPPARPARKKPKKAACRPHTVRRHGRAHARSPRRCVRRKGGEKRRAPHSRRKPARHRAG